MTRTLVALLLLILALPEPQSAQTRPAAERMAAIEVAQAAAGGNGLGALTIDELMKRFNVPGVSIAVIHDFNIHWAKGYGTADVETGASVNTETMFQAASISKPVAAMAVLRAVQDGLFTLDDDINTILTSWKLDGGELTKERPVTPRMLTSHTSGLGDGFGFPGYDPSAPRPTVVQVLGGHPSSNVGPLFMERAPMWLMEYSGGGVTLMQQALTDARKRPFAEIMRDHVLRPIGMEHSSFEQPISPERDRNAARAHSREGKSKGSKWHVYPEQAAAGLWTTPSDLARFAIEVQQSAVGKSNRVLSRTMVQEMLSPVGVGDYAVGFSISKRGQGWYFAHGGSNWGFQATLLAHKVKGYGLAIMTNANSGGAVMGELSRRIQAAYEWDSLAPPAPRGYRPPPPARPEIQVAEEILRTYVGDYQLSAELTLAITLEAGRLHVQPTGQPKYALVGESETTFFVREANARISFTKGPSGEVTALTLDQGGRQQPAKRIRPPADAARAFSALEDRLLKAETVRLDFHATAEGAVVVGLRGALHIGPADRILLTASGSFAGKPVDVALRSDGRELQIGSTTVRRPEHLKEALLIGLTRMGILHNLARLASAREPDRANGGVREWVTVGAFGARARESDALSFELTVAGQPAGSATLEIDANGRPVSRRQTVKFPSGEMRVTERYSAVTIDQQLLLPEHRR